MHRPLDSSCCRRNRTLGGLVKLHLPTPLPKPLALPPYYHLPAFTFSPFLALSPPWKCRPPAYTCASRAPSPAGKHAGRRQSYHARPLPRGSKPSLHLAPQFRRQGRQAGSPKMPQRSASPNRQASALSCCPQARPRCPRRTLSKRSQMRAAVCSAASRPGKLSSSYR